MYKIKSYRTKENVVCSSCRKLIEDKYHYKLLKEESTLDVLCENCLNRLCGQFTKEWYMNNRNGLVSDDFKMDYKW